MTIFYCFFTEMPDLRIILQLASQYRRQAPAARHFHQGVWQNNGQTIGFFDGFAEPALICGRFGTLEYVCLG